MTALWSQPSQEVDMLFLLKGNRAALPALMIGTLVAGGCRDDSDPTGPSSPTPVFQQSPAGQQSPHDPQVAFARAIPGFGGVFLDQNGTPTVYLTDVGQRPAAERALAAELRAAGASPAQLRVLKADYEYLQLDRWFIQVVPQALAVPGAVYVDVDEGSNRLRIGIESRAAEAAIRGVAARLNVPSAAVEVEVTDPIHFAATLRDKVSPKRGGLQIASGAGICTLGFNTWPQGVLTFKWFITASHCTKVQGGVEGTKFYQPTTSAAANLIGTEDKDPPLFTVYPCPSGRKCRWSDAARVKYVTGPGIDFGGIARTTGLGSITIDGANPVFNITAEKTKPLYLSTVHKIGRSTGWSKGVVISTCSALNVKDTNITLFCQSRVVAQVKPGDSGSPVFSWSGSGSNVTLHGILWGGNDAGTVFAFSPMSGVEAELGALSSF
jgi:hypothetical protein